MNDPHTQSSTHAVSRRLRPIVLVVACGLIAAGAIAGAPWVYQTISVTDGGATRDNGAISMRPRFTDTGTQVGQMLPEIQAVSLGNDAAEQKPLNELWSERPTVLVTASVSCDQSRAAQRALDELAMKFAGRVNFAILYTLEAHPLGSACPYLGFEFIPPENLSAGITPHQPQTLSERLSLAEQYRDTTEAKIPIYMDLMDNVGWSTLGGGPNIAVLIEPGGLVFDKQSWLDPAALTERIERLLEPHG